MPTQRRLSQVFVELANALVDDLDVVEFLTTLARARTGSRTAIVDEPAAERNAMYANRRRRRVRRSRDTGGKDPL